jgi:hypothetical protein
MLFYNYSLSMLKKFYQVLKNITVKMSATIDCPICMECIESTTKNCVTTECGHCFHTNCLMQSVAHNGFGCPYCRTKMAEQPEEEDDESIYSDEEQPEMFDDDALRGFRFFFNNINGEPHDQDDIDDEEEQDAEDWVDEEEYPDVPSTDFVAQKLRERGVTFEQLVKVLCLEHEEYSNDETADRISSELFGKIRIIVSNYNPEQVDLPPQPVIPIQPVPVLNVDFEAQPKNVTIRRIMSHV